MSTLQSFQSESDVASPNTMIELKFKAYARQAHIPWGRRRTWIAQQCINRDFSECSRDAKALHTREKREDAKQSLGNLSAYQPN